MKYLSVCSGIEAATTAWHHLGWKPVAFSEVEPFPSAVLAHHWPDTPNLGDMTKYESWNIGPESVDLLVGGTPCQSFSVAGLRKGLRDPRGGLMLTYLEIAQRFRPRWIVWENVPGVLSSNGGRDFGSLLGALVELGYGWAYRVLDAQWFGVAQRRRRVFVVGCLGDAASAAKVLFESESVRRDSPPSRKAQEDATSPHSRSTAGSDLGTDFDSEGDLALAFPSMMSGTQYASAENICPSLTAKNVMAVAQKVGAVRRLTSTECERLQGFPDDHTLISWRNKPADQCPDGPRYKALGNSMAVPVMRWIGERIQKVYLESLL